MIGPILSLLGSGLGGAMRLVPELLKSKGARADQDHEYRMAQLAAQSAAAGAAQGLAATQAQTLMAAIRGQEDSSGIHWVDALSKTVRPFVTYWWMTLFTVYKVSTVIVAFQQSAGLSDFGERIWTDNDWGVLSTILGFWFVDRAIVRGRKK